MFHSDYFECNLGNFQVVERTETFFNVHNGICHTCIHKRKTNGLLSLQANSLFKHFNTQHFSWVYEIWNFNICKNVYDTIQTSKSSWSNINCWKFSVTDVQYFTTNVLFQYINYALSYKFSPWAMTNPYLLEYYYQT